MLAVISTEPQKIKRGEVLRDNCKGILSEEFREKTLPNIQLRRTVRKPHKADNTSTDRGTDEGKRAGLYNRMDCRPIESGILSILSYEQRWN
jgi:hypothetical protein